MVFQFESDRHCKAAGLEWTSGILDVFQAKCIVRHHKGQQKSNIFVGDLTPNTYSQNLL